MVHFSSVIQSLMKALVIERAWRYVNGGVVELGWEYHDGGNLSISRIQGGIYMDWTIIYQSDVRERKKFVICFQLF